MGIRLDTLMISGLIFLSCIKVEEFTYGLNKLGVPFRISFAFSLAFRFLPTLLSTAEGIVEAQRCRGLEFESGGLVRKVKNHIPLLIPIFMYAIRKTDTLAMALEGRGFGFGKGRTYYLAFEMELKDYITILIFSLLASFCFYLRVKGIGCV
jgi:energy-coupling factor transport system permease protein